jgi:hypothetical protein
VEMRLNVSGWYRYALCGRNGRYVEADAGRVSEVVGCSAGVEGGMEGRSEVDLRCWYLLRMAEYSPSCSIPYASVLDKANVLQGCRVEVSKTCRRCVGRV